MKVLDPILWSSQLYSTPLQPNHRRHTFTTAAAVCLGCGLSLAQRCETYNLHWALRVTCTIEMFVKLKEKAVFQWKRAVPGPSAYWAPFLCYCAVDQENVVFQWKRAVPGPSALWGARTGQICFEFLLLRCRPRKGWFSMETNRFWASASLGPEKVKFAPIVCCCAVDQEKVFFQWKRTVSGPSASLRPKMYKFVPTERPS